MYKYDKAACAKHLAAIRKTSPFPIVSLPLKLETNMPENAVFAGEVTWPMANKQIMAPLTDIVISITPRVEMNLSHRTNAQRFHSLLQAVTWRWSAQNLHLKKVGKALLADDCR